MTVILRTMAKFRQYYNRHVYQAVMKRLGGVKGLGSGKISGKLKGLGRVVWLG
jgi:hypothetical protein